MPDNNKRLRSLIITLIILFSPVSLLIHSGCCGAQKPQKSNDVQLVLMVVVDQLRADIITRLEDRLGERGFRYLIQNGQWYQNARYSYPTTVTAVGHATLFTGTTPTGHGIVGNYWLDKQTGAIIKSVETTDPTQPSGKLMGPMQITGTTIGDELALAHNQQSRVFSVSIKDRGAILPGGYLGKAFWYDRENGGFRTGPYYYKNKKDEPGWLAEWNKLKKADAYKTQAWELFQDKEKYIFKAGDNRPVEKFYNEPPMTKRSAVFPHTLDKFKGREYYYQLCFTPFGDVLTVDFASHLLEAEKLGQGTFTDMLTVSLSVTDFIGHAYGPNSLEYEDNILHLDASLEVLFKQIERTVGLNRTLIVLTADHGTDLAPEYRERLGMPSGRVDPADFTTAINTALNTKFKPKEDKNFVLGFRNPSIFLDLEAVKTLDASIPEIEAVAAEAVMNVKGIAFTATRTDLLAGKVPSSTALRSLQDAFHPRRTGNILVLQKPFWFLYHVHDEDAAMHGAPYSYDSHVPIFFAGPRIRRGEVYRLVRPRDIAVTVALKLGIEAPTGSTGKPLIEVLR